MVKTEAQPPAADSEDTGNLRARALEAALEIAEERGWQRVRMRDVAELVGVPHARILDAYRDLDAVADAWFLRGWKGMLAPKAPGFNALPAQQRIETCMLGWFDALAPHREVTVQMLRGKAHLPHPHHWVPMIFNLSRTIQWLREAANLQAPYGTRRAEMEEVGLTWLFVATLWVWSRDQSLGQQRTRRFLRRRLSEADNAMTQIWGPGHPPEAPIPPPSEPPLGNTEGEPDGETVPEVDRG